MKHTKEKTRDQLERTNKGLVITVIFLTLMFLSVLALGYAGYLMMNRPVDPVCNACENHVCVNRSELAITIHLAEEDFIHRADEMEEVITADGGDVQIWHTFLEKLGAAKVVLEDKDATQSEIDNALLELRTAHMALQEYH